MKQEKLLLEAINYAQKNGHQIISGGAIFDWTKDPPDCSPYGALLLLHKKDYLIKNEFQSGWLKEICSLLDVDEFWFRRFWLGFDRGFQVEFIECNDKGKIIKTTLDDVSNFGIKLAKKFVK